MTKIGAAENFHACPKEARMRKTHKQENPYVFFIYQRLPFPEDAWAEENDKKNYLNYKVPSLAIQEHIHSPICFRCNLVPYNSKTNLVSGSKTVNFVEPKTSKEVGDRNMLSYYHTSFGNICKPVSYKNLYQSLLVMCHQQQERMEENKPPLPLVMGSLASEYGVRPSIL